MRPIFYSQNLACGRCAQSRPFPLRRSQSGRWHHSNSKLHCSSDSGEIQNAETGSGQWGNEDRKCREKKRNRKNSQTKESWDWWVGRVEGDDDMRVIFKDGSPF